MKLKYIGKYSPIVVMVKNKDGGMGLNIKTGECFECDAGEAAKILAKFNEKNKEPKFVEASNAGRPKGEPEKKKMVEGAEKKA